MSDTIPRDPAVARYIETCTRLGRCVSAMRYAAEAIESGDTIALQVAAKMLRKVRAACGEDEDE